VSLRLRLLIAVGAVALIALAIADVVTYQELRSFLYNRIDQSLEQSHMPIEAALGGRPQPVPGGGLPPGPSSSSPSNPSSSSPSNPSSSPSSPSGSCDGFAGLTDALMHELSPGTFVEVRSAKDVVLCKSTQPALGSTETVTPRLPTRITGFVSNTADFGEPTVYLDSAKGAADDASYRMRVSVLEAGPYRGGQLLVGVPLGVEVVVRVFVGPAPSRCSAAACATSALSSPGAPYRVGVGEIAQHPEARGQRDASLLWAIRNEPTPCVRL